MGKAAQEKSLTCEQLGLEGLTIPQVVLLDQPADGVPTVISTPRGLENAAKLLSNATGPVAIDTERASGIRYGQRAFLVQIKRGDSGIILIDPEAFDDLTPINNALRGCEWVIHAAGQDLPSLRELGMKPDLLFDTELASRLAGLERVALGTVVEQLLGFRLAKQHSAEDWSKRPLPQEWLAYAALDVEILVDLRDCLEEILDLQKKLDYALQEFAHLVSSAAQKTEPPDPWRKTKGIGQVKNRRQLTALRNLWHERENLARAKDIAPKRLLPDSSLIQAARQMPSSVPAVLKIPGFQTRALRREAPRWVRAVAQARSVPTPVPFTTPATGPPPLKAWETKRPESYILLQQAKEALKQLAKRVNIPQENILLPDSLRRLCWEPPGTPSEQNIAAKLYELQARPWQVNLVLPALLPVFRPFTSTPSPQEKDNP